MSEAIVPRATRWSRLVTWPIAAFALAVMSINPINATLSDGTTSPADILFMTLVGSIVYLLLAIIGAAVATATWLSARSSSFGIPFVNLGKARSMAIAACLVSALLIKAFGFNDLPPALYVILYLGLPVIGILAMRVPKVLTPESNE